MYSSIGFCTFYRHAWVGTGMASLHGLVKRRPFMGAKRHGRVHTYRQAASLWMGKKGRTDIALIASNPPTAEWCGICCNCRHSIPYVCSYQTGGVYMHKWLRSGREAKIIVCVVCVYVFDLARLHDNHQLFITVCVHVCVCVGWMTSHVNTKYEAHTHYIIETLEYWICLKGQHYKP